MMLPRHAPALKMAPPEVDARFSSNRLQVERKLGQQSKAQSKPMQLGKGAPVCDVADTRVLEDSRTFLAIIPSKDTAVNVAIGIGHLQATGVSHGRIIGEYLALQPDKQ